jgi:hypothetical protein
MHDLDFNNITEGQVLWTFCNDGEDLDGWVAFGGCLWYVFVWMETLTKSSGWHRRGHIRAWNTVGAKCWD